MKENDMSFVLMFVGKVLRQAKTYRVRFQAQYHMPTNDFPEAGWVICADWRDKNNKHVYTKIILEDETMV